MMDTLMIYGYVATMRHAGYLTVAAAVLGLAEAHYPGLRRAVQRVTAWLANGFGTARRGFRSPEAAAKRHRIKGLVSDAAPAQNFRHPVGLGHSRSSLS